MKTLRKYNYTQLSSTLLVKYNGKNIILQSTTYGLPKFILKPDMVKKLIVFLGTYDKPI